MYEWCSQLIPQEKFKILFRHLLGSGVAVFFGGIAVLDVSSQGVPPDFRAVDYVSGLISKKDCAGAEAYARSSFQAPMLHTVLGMVELDCKAQKGAAIEYFKLAANLNEPIARDYLVKLGYPPAMQSLRSAPQPIPAIPNNDQLYVAPPVIEQPPAHAFSPLVRPRYAPTVIIAPPVYVVPVSPAACIQDGGATFCPHYRRW